MYDVFKYPTEQLKEALIVTLQKRKRELVIGNDFIFSQGTLPVLMVAHIDTVHVKPVKDICVSKSGILMSPQGIGGDDRCGVLAVLEIMKTHDVSVLFTDKEEIGCIGAEEFITHNIPIEMNYIIEFDRRGDKDAVFYNDSNEQFQEFITSFGFVFAHGSFSDISVIAPHYGVSAVNLSSAYWNPHTIGEYVDINMLYKNIEIAKKIIDTPTEKFKYVAKPIQKFDYSKFDYSKYDDVYVQTTSVLSVTPKQTFKCYICKKNKPMRKEYKKIAGVCKECAHTRCECSYCLDIVDKKDAYYDIPTKKFLCNNCVATYGKTPRGNLCGFCGKTTTNPSRTCDECSRLLDER